ncbi:MAG TPA: SGNH/GDSL hydrolase family protein, partial [Solirubrobacterales bacterium]|nr:SGNH/GDSL hydrolase family protein [Solirubrobacterales bacterium]
AAHNSHRWLRVTAMAVVMVLAAFAAFVGVARGADYVALGDSYTAGPLIPNQVPPYGCLKSDHNFPRLAAPSIGLPLRDISCSGAETEDMTAPQGVDPDGPNPPQFSALEADTGVVSITIGGNDIGFSEIAESCVTVNPFATPCQDKYNPGGQDEIAERIAETAPKVRAALEGIRERSPEADVYVLNYAAIFPETGFGCWPQMPIGYADVPYLRAKQRQLNAMIADQATATGATLVDWYAASIGHDACKGPLTRWVEPLAPVNPAAPIHPNLAGMRGAARALLTAIG